MILRRLASAIRRQDWLAVLIEFVIVVTGIVVAIQLDNWNEARKDRILEEQLFAALRADLLETRADLVTDIEAAERIAKNTRNLIKVITSDEPPSNSGKDLLWRQIGTSRLYKKDFAYRALVAQGLGQFASAQLGIGHARGLGGAAVHPVADAALSARGHPFKGVRGPGSRSQPHIPVQVCRGSFRFHPANAIGEHIAYPGCSCH